MEKLIEEMTGQAFVIALGDFLIDVQTYRMHANKPYNNAFVICSNSDLFCNKMRLKKVQCKLLHKSHSYLLVRQIVDTHA